jgi:hypothetical protein
MFVNFQQPITEIIALIGFQLDSRLGLLEIFRKFQKSRQTYLFRFSHHMILVFIPRI